MTMIILLVCSVSRRSAVASNALLSCLCFALVICCCRRYALNELEDVKYEALLAIHADSQKSDRLIENSNLSISFVLRFVND